MISLQTTQVCLYKGDAYIGMVCLYKGGAYTGMVYIDDSNDTTPTIDLAMTCFDLEGLKNVVAKFEEAIDLLGANIN